MIPSDSDELRNWLWDNVPLLEDSYARKDLIGTARILRDWVGRHATFSHRELLLDHNTLPVHELLGGVLEYRGGMWCGGVAELCTQLMRLIPGVVAAKYNYGIRPEYKEAVTHMTVLVGTQEGIVYNLDPYIGYEWNLPFGEVLGHIKERRYQEIRMIDTPLPRPAITLPGESPGFDWLFPDGVPEPEMLDNRWVYHGATPSWGGLFGEGSPNRVRADEYRGDQALDEWLLDLMLSEPELGRFSAEYGWNEYNCIRQLFYDMVGA